MMFETMNVMMSIIVESIYGGADDDNHCRHLVSLVGKVPVYCVRGFG